ncbi:MAG: BlaI/MecI/CopY family transcriptional regulator [bacterium]
MDHFSQITDSEWQIMRILWEKSPLTATEVTDRLFRTKAWSLTTVKTFLCRLTEKKIIAYDLCGRSYLYTPLVTERHCVEQEMKAVLNRVYGGELHFETDHFRFYGDPQQDYIERLGRSIEEQYRRLATDFEFVLAEKQMVYVYATQSRLHSALGDFNGPSWLRAGWGWDVLHIAPESCFTDLSPENALLHVFVQRMIAQINPYAPYWVQQGVSAYESKWLNAEKIRNLIRDDRYRRDLDTVRKLTIKYDDFKVAGGYELSYTVIEYIVQIRGHAGLLAFIRNPEAWLGAYGADGVDFWSGWKTFIEQKYASKEVMKP